MSFFDNLSIAHLQDQLINCCFTFTFLSLVETKELTILLFLNLTSQIPQRKNLCCHFVRISDGSLFISIVIVNPCF